MSYQNWGERRMVREHSGIVDSWSEVSVAWRPHLWLVWKVGAVFLGTISLNL